ncbi:MAG: efflux transporter outer membrane subunit [Giesbergeria sp.]
MQNQSHPHSSGSILRGTLALAIASLLSACASPGAPHAPLSVTAPQALGLMEQATQTERLPQTQWWTVLGDPQLDALMVQALAQQPSLLVARARAAQATALANARRAANGPQATLSADATRQRYTANGLVPPPVAGNVYDSANLQATLAWAPDFFGLHRAELEASLGQARAAEADAAAAANTLGTQLARAYVALARVLAEQRVAEQTLTQRQKIERLTHERVSAGLDSNVELTQTQGALPDARVQIEVLDEQATLARRQIAVLAGQAPDSQATLTPRLAALLLPAVPEVLGADLLGRRPDVVAARWRIEAATQGVAAAQSEFYPNINLTAFVGLNALGLDNLLHASSRQLGVSPALHLPIFDGGRLRAQLGGRQADLDAVIAQYNAAVLGAAKQAGDAIASLASIERQQRLQQQAGASADRAFQFAQERYGAGLGNYLVVLGAESQVLAQRRQAVALQARALDTRLALMSALGGGWSDDTAHLQLAAH